MNRYGENFEREYFSAKRKAYTYQRTDYLSEYIVAPLFRFWRKHFMRLHSFFEGRHYLAELKKEKGWTEEMKKKFLVGIKIRQDANLKAIKEQRQPEYDIFSYAANYRQQKATAEVIEKHFQRRLPASENKELSFSKARADGFTPGYIARDCRIPDTEYMVKYSDLPSSDDKMDFIREYVFGALFRLVLHENAPLISAVKRSEVVKRLGDVPSVALRSEFLKNFKTFAEFIFLPEIRIKVDNNQAIHIQGVAKVIAAVLFFGETDWHSENIGVVTNSDGQLVLAKIDHGKAGCKIFRDPEEVMQYLRTSYIDGYGYDAFLTLRAKELSEALDEIARSLTDDEIEKIIRIRIGELSKMSKSEHESEEEQEQRRKFFKSLEGNFIKALKQQRKVMEKFSQWLGDIATAAIPEEYLKGEQDRKTKWENGGWLTNSSDWITQRKKESEKYYLSATKV